SSCAGLADGALCAAGVCLRGACLAVRTTGSGCDCQSAGGGAAAGLFWILTFFLWVFRRRLRVLLLLLFLFTTPAWAGTASVDVERFAPNIDGRGLFNTESPDAHDPFEWSAGLMLQYARRPFVLRLGSTRIDDLVANRL